MPDEPCPSERAVATGARPLMRVAHVVAPAAFGGLERVVAGLCRETALRGHSVLLIATLAPGAELPAWAAELQGSGVSVAPVHVPSRAYLAERRAVRGLLRRFRAEVVHTHGYRSDVVHAGVVRGEGIPLVSTAHGFASSRGIGLVYEWLQRRAWRRFDAVVAVSRPLLDVLSGLGIPRDRLVFIQNGLSGAHAPVDRREARTRLGLPQDARVVGWVGRFSEEKNAVLAIEALARTTDRAVRLCMIGAGPTLEHCRALAHDRGLSERVRFCGAVPDAGPLVSAFDVLMLSSRTEGTPMVVLEAAAAGVAVVSTSVGGVPDLLGRDGGWLVPADDAAALAVALDEAASDPAQAARRAERLQARLLAGPVDWVSEYLALYSRLIGA